MSPVFHAHCLYFYRDCSSDLFIFQKQDNKKKVIKKKKSFFAIQYTSPLFGCDAEVDQKNVTKIKYTHLCTSGAGVFATM